MTVKRMDNVGIVVSDQREESRMPLTWTLGLRDRNR